jgi:predicted NUDIX family phosphoesterase
MKKNRQTPIQATVIPAPEKPKEQVLVFPADAIDIFYDDFTKAGGVVKHAELVNMVLDDIFKSGRLHYMDRETAENDPNFKQVIPYTVLMRGRTVLRYQRTKKGGDARIHDKWSIGAGGHINPCDGDVHTGSSDDFYGAAFRRELLEEVSLEGYFVAPILGLIYDDSDAIGRVHFGIVHCLDVPHTATLGFKDPALANGEFRHVLDLKRSEEEFENWSKLVIDNLLP